jgi:hypothetical protein
LAAETTLMIHDARRNEGGMPRLHVERISSFHSRRSFVVVVPPPTTDDRGLDDHDESGGTV